MNLHAEVVALKQQVAQIMSQADNVRMMNLEREVKELRELVAMIKAILDSKPRVGRPPKTSPVIEPAVEVTADGPN